MSADDMTCRLRHIPVVTVGLSGTERSVGGPHTGIVGVETTVVTATRGLLVSLCPPGWSGVSE